MRSRTDARRDRLRLRVGVLFFWRLLFRVLAFSRFGDYGSRGGIVAAGEGLYED